jgi:hypothetical protein
MAEAMVLEMRHNTFATNEPGPSIHAKVSLSDLILEASLRPIKANF